MSDKEQYKIYPLSSTSRDTAKVNDLIVLSKTKTTRKVLTAVIVQNNTKNPNATVKITIKPQKKCKNNTWEDSDKYNLAKLKMDQEVQLILDCAETLNLFNELKNLYEVSTLGVSRGDIEVIAAPKETTIVTSKNTASSIKNVLDTEDPSNILNILEQENPELVTNFSITQILKIEKILLRLSKIK